MHCLENMLLIMSERVRSGENFQKLADDLVMLASESHVYIPETGKERLAELNGKWNKKYRK
jgi:hypothetical protein